MKSFLLFTALLYCNVAAQAQTPIISAGGVANAANFDSSAGVAPGSMVVIFGTSLASGLSRMESVPLSTSIANVSVTFNGVAAPLQTVSSNVITAQVPWNVLPDPTVPGTADVVVSGPGIQSQAATVAITPAAPAIYRVHPWTTQAMALNSDGTLTAAVGSIDGFQSHPANVGDTILLYANGLGAVTPAINSGANSQDVTRITMATPSVLIEGVPASVTFSGLSPRVPGLNLLNIVVPAGITSSDTALVQIRIGSITTTDQITISVRGQ